MISEVPLGAFLSGGVDSSAIVGMMSQISEKPVKTFSIGFNEDSFDELKYARIAAKHFKTEHHEFVVTPDLVETIDELVWHFDEPFADSSALADLYGFQNGARFRDGRSFRRRRRRTFRRLHALCYRQKTQRFGNLPQAFRKRFLKPLSEASAARSEGQKLSL